MACRIFADLTVVVHLGFVLFVVLGGLAALRWRWVLWLHCPAVVWSVLIEFFGWTCPLTPLENWLRELGEAAGYRGSFIEHYVVTLLYPEGLTRRIQIRLDILVLTVNGLIDWRVFARSSGCRSS